MSDSVDERDLDGLSEDELVAYYAEEIKRAEADDTGRPRSRGLVLAGVVVGALALVGVVTAIVLGGAPGGAGPDADRDADPSASPSADKTPEIVVPSVESLEIPAGQSPEATAESIARFFSDWGMAGANRENFENQVVGDNGYLSLSEYLDKIVAANSAVYGRAIYGENYTDPAFQDAIKLAEDYNRGVLTSHFQTYGNQNKQQYTQTSELLSETHTLNTDGTISYLIESVRVDNGDQTIIGENNSGYVTRSTIVVGEINGIIKAVQPETFLK